MDPRDAARQGEIEARRLFSVTHRAREMDTVRANMFCGRSKSRKGSAVEDNKPRRFKMLFQQMVSVRIS